MPRKIVNALTPLAVKNAKPGRHADGGGLYVLVKESGARSWVYRATIAGKVRDIGLGPAAGAEAVSLADARELARDKAKEAKPSLPSAPTSNASPSNIGACNTARSPLNINPQMRPTLR